MAKHFNKMNTLTDKIKITFIRMINVYLNKYQFHKLLKLMNQCLMKYMPLFFLACIISCQNMGKKTNNSKPISIVQQNTNTNDNKENSIIGVWKLEGEESPNFELRADSIYYVDHDKSYKYLITKDSIFIFYDDWTYRGCYVLQDNQLVIKEGDNVSKYIRLK